MTLISIKKTAVVEAAPTGTVSLYVDSADSHLKQVDEAGAIIDLTDGSAISSPNMAQLINITLETLVVDVVGEGLINPKATYRITDAAQGVIRVFGKSATELTATAMLEGTDDGTGSITAGQWGNYDLDGDVFTSVIPYLVAQLQIGAFVYDTEPTLTVLSNQLGGTYAIDSVTGWSITVTRTGDALPAGVSYALITQTFDTINGKPTFSNLNSFNGDGGDFSFVYGDGGAIPTTPGDATIPSFVVQIYFVAS